MKLKAAVIGLGFVGRAHVESLRRIGIQVIGAMGSTGETSAAACKSLGLERAYASLQELAEDKNVDVVHLCTPNYLHFEEASLLLRAGKHVLCEKPLTMDSRESEILVSIAKETGKVVGVAYNLRYYPLCHEARALVEKGAIGQPKLVHGSFLQDWLLYPSDCNLKEQVGWRRWSAVLIGFAGVLIAMRPSAASFTWPALIALTGCLFFSFLMIVTRTLRGTSDLVLLSTQMAGTLVLGAFLAPIGWVTPTARDFSLLALLGLVAMFAHLCVNRSLKLAPASLVVPYQYTFILWAMVFGYFVFSDVPGAPLIAGAVIIVAAGIFIFRREHARAVKDDIGIPPPAA